MKAEFSKIVLGSAVVIWAAGAVFGAYIVNEERELLPELLAYIGALTAAELAANHANDVAKYGGND